MISVPINKLSDVDRRYLQSLRTAKPTPKLPTESFDIVLVRDGKPVHNMICLPNDEADPAAVLALKEYRTLVKKATGVEPVRVAEPVPDTPTIFFGRNPWSTKAVPRKTPLLSLAPSRLEVLRSAFRVRA